MILLSFDIEEFDMPLEYDGQISLEQQLQISRTGTIAILDVLKKYNAKATFFSTVIFAESNQDIIHRLLEEGHELASHTWFHSDFKNEHLKSSRERLSELFDTEVIGLRMPRMSPVDETEVKTAGYVYNSSINPIFLPGRYNNLGVSKSYFKLKEVIQIPASVSPIFRIPLFWLSFHNFPTFLYRYLAKRSWKDNGYLNIYFHPWEFADIKNSEFKLPNFTTKNTGQDMIARFDTFLEWLVKNKQKFCTIKEFVDIIN
ncbi:polysaccharide deacetylase family protein [Chryseobacterium sp. POL2]|uniref:polysaccharide deacetylase family protein n=1 Tax=Chryseobacterium sp. POL2 TaxID=2713414 RepID=UPI0013E1320A|nr:polysaccharide deacetylase family protein [Chryseobacterium sp. POL2]QIG88364.1 polysaccharide deacetylase family protein [Chryseobacterium sp. POL2]